MRNIFFVILLFVSSIGVSQTPTLQALVSKQNVHVGGNFTVSYQFNYSGEDFTAPSNITKDFRILSGPSKRSEMRYNNGKVTSNLSYTYVLSPLNPGEYVLEPAKITFENKTYASKSIQIIATKAQTPQQQKDQTTQSEINREAKQKQSLKNSIYLRLELNKRTVFQGEQIVATYKLYNKAALRGIEAQRMPEFDGFYTADIKIDNTNNSSREVINGVPFDVHVLKKTILIPQKTGELTLIPLEIDAIVQVQGKQVVNTWFGPRYQMKDVKLTLKSNAIKINVKPLPKGAPDSFDGAVGRFKFNVSLTPTELKVNDALTYTVKLSGSGNLPLIKSPVPNWPQEFEVYDPKLKSTVNTKTNKLTGFKRWEYLAIPRNNGEYIFEPVEFTFFNTSSKKYETISSGAATITVTGTSDYGSKTNPNAVNKQDVSRLGTDIRFIHTNNPELKIVDDTFFGSVWYYFWLIAPIFLSALAYLILRKQNELKSDTVGLKKRKATKLARQLLKTAEKNLNSKDKNLFYESVFKALNGYLANKLNISNADLNKSNINSKLISVNASEVTINLLFETLDHCEMARFAPVTNISDTDLLKQAQDVLVKLENEIK
jgi:hypothetical protein